MDRGAVMSTYAEAARWRRDNPDALPGLLVGQAAPRNPAHGSRHALFPFPRNCAGERLWRMSGWDLVDWFARFDRINTIREFPGAAPSGKGDSFPLPLARECAARMRVEMSLSTRHCVFVGKANANVHFAGLPEPFRLEEQDGGGLWAWVPHTSGVVPFWNSPENRAKLAGLFTTFWEKVWGEVQKVA